MTMPDRYRTAAIPHLMVENAPGAIDFYTRAFGADEVFRIAHPDGRVLHAELTVGGSIFMVGDVADGFTAPSTVGRTTVGVHVFVDDVAALCDRAVAAGATVQQPATDMFYGARTVMLTDPYGHVWVFLTHLEDVPPDEIARRGTQLLASS